MSDLPSASGTASGPAATTSPVAQATSVAQPVLLDREQSILAFNRRVLAQAQRADVPLLERLRYITIVSSNLDEFFEVRLPDVIDAHREGGTLPAGQLRAVSAEAHALTEAHYAVFNDEVMPALRAAGLLVLNHAERNAAQRAWVARFFESQVRPLLVPIGLDPAHPFPLVANKSLNFIVRLGGRDAFGRASSIAIVKVPRALPRVIRLPDALMPAGQQGFVLLSSVIRAHLGTLFPRRPVDSFSQFRVTRDSDLEVDDEEVANLRQAVRRSLGTRHFGEAIRLEVVATCPVELSDFLLQQFALPLASLYRVNGPVNLVRLAQLIDQASDPAPPAEPLRFAPFEPAWPSAQLAPGTSVLERLRQGDLLLHHPFESFDPVLQFLREAVHDPDVLAIKQTIYRTGSDSAMMELLIDAARRGKEVLVVVELKARFDEEANVNWAERLEAVGAQVVYGIVGLKTHAKLLLVTRREAGGRLHRYVHLSTGNYNTRTARQYTDLGMLSADPELAADADAVFQQLASLTRPRALRRLLTAPTRLHRRMMSHIAQVSEAARAGRPARIVAKMNALTEPALIGALHEAACAGAEVDLIVRGACTLAPLADAPAQPSRRGALRVRSIVGRFLEHTRVAYFRWGEGEDDEVLYLSSADWMSRNMFGRVELAWALHDAALRQRVIDECLVPYLHDTLDAWQLDADGRYTRLGAVKQASGRPLLSAQQALMRKYGWT